MPTKHLRALALTVAAGAIALSVSNAAAASAASVTVLRSGDGDTLRAKFYDGPNFTGDVLVYYGGSACTATTTDNEYTYSDLRIVGWNDRIESIQDFNSCDVKLYRDINLGGPSAYADWTPTGRNCVTAWRNVASGFRVS
ncbi:hypothetical protein GTR02_00175 [Kineococcus sp. R8]|uniref:peptidase inhibitor family I36 protein n=1 Tax=Kineococcus siccus TaxID=2696567 RepID=UPI001412F6AD|nr:peptidase inhibitor family I36 protein [Kineococcus siccus]NAZ80237.1 hypothetical protein [Kineococcus siccus]